MVDVIKSLGVPYICGNPGSSFRGLQESIVNYGGNEQPEFLTCLHEESAVAMAHGYAKIEGKPLIVLAHGTVGLQHASMAIYNACCDRVPVYVILGNTLDAAMRYPGVEWVHSVQDAAAMVRDYVKWDDAPVSLQHFAESAVRAYKVAMTPQAGPVVLVADSELQERPIPANDRLRVPKLTLAAPPQADSGAVAEVARLLVGATNPVLIADRAARTAGRHGAARRARRAAAGVGRQHAAEHDAADRRRADEFPVAPSAQPDAAQRGGDRRRRRRRRPRNRELLRRRPTPTATRSNAARSRPRKPGAKLITITAGELSIKANYQDFQRYSEVDLALAGDAEATLPVAHRSGEAPDHRRSQARLRGTRRQAGRREPDRQGPRARRCDLRVGRGSHQHGAPGGGSLGAGPNRKTGRS